MNRISFLHTFMQITDDAGPRGRLGATLESIWSSFYYWCSVLDLFPDFWWPTTV